MPADKAFMEYVMELLVSFDGISSRAMFGGYGIFHNNKMFALISGSQLYFKVNESTKTIYEKAGSHQFKPMPYYEVPVDVMENSDAFREWAEEAISIGDATPPKKKKRSS